ncbi:MAG: c-type cytochrome [Rhodanobacter sp.]|nr:MAG: c-type cytochrome [Rhodanobacter sp.]TAM13163.1 MAG: c-type cytochrome [Rhodanobacter sp.]TAM35163.1 MAG: c-type cytochrome [Rhodanobacter sp.]
MAGPDHQAPTVGTWSAVAGTALRVAFGMVWLVGAALTYSPDFAAHYVGYLHNAANGQPAWSAWWFAMWIGLVTPHAGLFVWLTRFAETALALALIFGFARKTTYIVGLLFSLLIWSTAEGFGGPYSVGVTNIGAALSYVLIFAALIIVNYRVGPSLYSVDYLIEKRWPTWRTVAEWNVEAEPNDAARLPWRVQAPALGAIVVLVALLLAGLQSALNVKSASPTAAAAAVSPLSLASSAPVKQARDAALPPVAEGNSVDVNIASSNDTVEIASGVQYQAWTFGKTVPGPVIHVRQGQTVNVTFTNRGTMQHSIDFHSAITPPSLHYVELMPGESIKFSFVAHVPGAFLYHCGTPPVMLHIANGMYGAIIVDPATPLPAAQESYVLVQGEWYTSQVAGKLMGANFDKMQEIRPDEVVFNGAAFQYRDHPLTAKPGDLVRLYVVNAGPSLWSAFHVIGGIFDKVYPGGNPAQAIDGVSTYSVGPGEGAIFDLKLDEPGKYPFVDHSMAHAQLGAIGVLQVQKPGEALTKPEITKAAAPESAAVAPPPAATGPYKFDPARGNELYATNCAACHQASGEGLPATFPPLKGNPAVLDADPAKQISVILHGLQGQAINGQVYPGAMPPFAGSLNDADIADIANHERTSWGNQGKTITADQVKAARAAGGK